MSEKIRDSHRRRQAILYIRQSSLGQVARNEESRRLQYAMEERLRRLGFTDVEVVDDDLGRSASGTSARAGFERMVAQVCLGTVGAVAARELSRFSRNSRDWQQLVEVCKMVDTLLIDQECVYDARRGNDRLLLGLKGSLSEYELDILRLRSLEARHEKAKRGELITTLAVGYEDAGDGRIVKDADRRVQEAIARVFEKFLSCGAVRPTLLWFLAEGLDLPVRRSKDPRRSVVWKRPTYARILHILRNPIYAGTYAYGKSASAVEYRDGLPRKRTRRRPEQEWLARLHDHHEPYVDRARFERIQEMITRNGPRGSDAGPTAARTGAALLSGLLRCRRCGRKLAVVYTGRGHDVLRYVCKRGALDAAEPNCISFAGLPVDAAMAASILRVLEPAAIAASARLAADAQAGRSDASEAIRLALEQARYEADRAHRQYDAAEPENRLVAQELERRWNDALRQVERLQVRLAEVERERARVARPEASAVGDVRHDVQRAWNAPDGDARLRKRIVRTLVEELVVDVDRTAGEIVLVTHWKGGVHTEQRLPCRRRGWNRAQTAPEAVEAVAALARACDDDVIAGALNRNGLRTGHGQRWTIERVRALRRQHDIPDREDGADEWYTLTAAAARLGIGMRRLRRAAEQAHVVACHPLSDGPWLFRRAEIERPDVMAYFAKPRSAQQPTGRSSDDAPLFNNAEN